MQEGFNRHDVDLITFTSTLSSFSKVNEVNLKLNEFDLMKVQKLVFKWDMRWAQCYKFFLESELY